MFVISVGALRKLAFLADNWRRVILLFFLITIMLEASDIVLR